MRGAKYVLLGVLIVASLSSLLFTKTVASPNNNVPSNSALGYKIIPTSVPLAQGSTDAQITNNKFEGGINILNLGPIHSGLAESSDPQLRKLAEYEQSVNGAVASGMLIFTNTPITVNEARDNAADLSARLKEFAKFNIKPIVIMEPTTNGGPLDYSAYSQGHYDPALKALFSSLKLSGINSTTLGTWVPFAEDNAPLWGNTDPSDFAANVTKTVQIQKQYFPNSQASILLNGQTYSSSDINWENGKFSSLVPYVKNIPRGLLNSIGLQGFPWASPADDSGAPIFSAKDFLPINLAEESANYMGIQQIWLNTGTFGRNYTNDRTKTIKVSSAQRQQTLNSIAVQSKKLQADGFVVAVNLFSADKSNLDEATDWSYWHEDTFANNLPDKAVFIDFAGQIHASGLELWLFDSSSP